MTRSRATGNVPNEAARRATTASAPTRACIVTEGTAPSANGLGYARIPGMFSDAQVAGWRAGHRRRPRRAAGASSCSSCTRGRISHPTTSRPAPASSAPRRCRSPMYTDPGPSAGNPVPGAPRDDRGRDSPRIAEFAHASRGPSRRASTGSSCTAPTATSSTSSQHRVQPAHRRWGGDAAGRLRFAIEVARAARRPSAPIVWRPRVAVRGVQRHAARWDTDETCTCTWPQALSELGLVYLHVVDHAPWARRP
jgi:N-ethylmaleimide reductase